VRSHKNCFGVFCGAVIGQRNGLGCSCYCSCQMCMAVSRPDGRRPGCHPCRAIRGSHDGAPVPCAPLKLLPLMPSATKLHCLMTGMALAVLAANCYAGAGMFHAPHMRKFSTTYENWRRVETTRHNSANKDKWRLAHGSVWRSAVSLPPANTHDGVPGTLSAWVCGHPAQRWI
jgi:hypothetical protein